MLSNRRVQQMRDLVQAIDDEAIKDQKRETAERAAFERPQALQDMKKVHREERRLGKQYIQALQRDQEVILHLSIYYRTALRNTPNTKLIHIPYLSPSVLSDGSRYEGLETVYLDSILFSSIDSRSYHTASILCHRLFSYYNSARQDSSGETACS